MRKLPVLRVACCGLLALVPALTAAELGDPAPPLKIAEWIKGQSVDLADGKGKNIYVVEFWATWCPPCRTSIPHLTDVQKKFKDQGVVLIGISNEKVPTVRKFVEKMGEKMDYVVAVDDADKTSQGYMKAFGIRGIPHAFIVDKQSRIVWHGHPMAELEKTLEDLIAGKYDMAMAKKRARGQELLQEFFAVVSDGKDDARANELARELESIDEEVGGLMRGQKFDAAEVRKMIQFQAALRKYQEAILEARDDAELEQLANAAEAAAPKNVNFGDIRGQLELQALYMQYRQAVTGEVNETKAAALAKRLGSIESKNASMLNEMAWAILTDQRITKRDIPLALKLAKKAYDASEGEDAAIVDTYARALFDSGKVSEAIQYQKKAVELAKGSELEEQLKGTLKDYEKAKAK